MRAVVCNQFGPPEDLSVVELADPEPEPGQVLIEVKAASVTFPDTLMLEDKYQFKADLPYVPGGEVAGIVTALGDGVDTIEVGSRVLCPLGSTGGYAELAVAGASAARVLPDEVDFADSTGLLYAHGTTYYGLKYRGELQEGETLLVLGAGGHVGLSAVELGNLMGARVIAAASTEEKLDLCRARGASETINYSEENLKERAKELTGGAGVDVVYDVVGGDYAEQALRAIGWGGPSTRAAEMGGDFKHGRAPAAKDLESSATTIGGVERAAIWVYIFRHHSQRWRYRTGRRANSRPVKKVFFSKNFLKESLGIGSGTAS